MCVCNTACVLTRVCVPADWEVFRIAAERAKIKFHRIKKRDIKLALQKSEKYIYAMKKGK